ncbi:hypothetical protein AHMF7605_20140 [Adhaeribacter arboris]|uniref:Lipoprotein n=1 Tax=Adhaeribacter arboris TaxID=2072846 RepID=A0A2T2YJH1_9BACT|nr:hypothetical protein [Adhaeribacter arboris]PSR55651.1 hypothetical protein AHMF7605_20140 [Adhaeribacter arboris]
MAGGKKLHFKFCFFVIGLAMTSFSCEDTTSVIYENSVLGKQQFVHTIELIAFGATDDSINPHNRGYRADFYAHFNLSNDSIYTRQQISFFEQKEITAKLGFCNSLSTSKELVDLLAVIKQLKPGLIKQTNVPDGVLYCGKDYCLVYTCGASIKRYYFTRFNLLPEFEMFIDYAENTEHDTTLIKDDSQFDEDNVLSNIVNRVDFPRFKTIPPPVVSTVGFTPPAILRD